ncbi:MAG: ABC transporter substrate-binding protein [Coriobacteriales bacterium]|nr:ABC transporter substrate-binding protein [Coriobacteriales bacterium]
MSQQIGLSLSRRMFCAAGLMGGLALATVPLTATFASEAGRPAATQPAKAKAPEKIEALELPATIKDDMGREVTITAVDRVVACMGSYARMWQLAGGAPLIGVTDDATQSYDDLVLDPDCVSVGAFTAPNAEQIMALAPDLVIMSGSTRGMGGKSTATDIIDPLTDAGIPVACFSVTTFEDYARTMALLCSLTGDNEAYQANVIATRKRIDAIVDACLTSKTEPVPSLIGLTTYSGGTTVMRSTTQVGSIVKDLGAINLADENPSLLDDYSLESLVALDPQYILLMPTGNSDEATAKSLADQTESNPVWSELTAVKEGRCAMLTTDVFQSKPLEAWDKTYRTIAEIIYPEVKLP